MLLNYSNQDGFGGLLGDNIKELFSIKDTKDFLVDIDDFGLDNLSINQVEEFAEQYDNLNSEALQYVKDVKDGNIELQNGQTLLEGFKNQTSIFDTLGNKIKSIGKSAINIFGQLSSVMINGLASALISWGITKALSKLNDLRKEVGLLTKNEVKELRESLVETAEAASSSIEEMSKQYANTEQVVSDIGYEYANLAQGVKDLGLSTQSQGSLSTDEYNRFLEISNQLAEVFPDLKTGITNEGDALLSLNGSVETITTSLQNLLDAEQQLVTQQINEKMPDVWAGYGINVGKASKDYNDALKQLKLYKELRQNLEDNSDMTFEEFELQFGYGEELTNAFKDAGLNYEDYLQQNVGQEQFKQLFDGIISDYQKNVDNASLVIKSENKKLGDNIVASLQDNVQYNNLDDNGKNIIKIMLENMDYDIDYSELRTKEDWDTVYNSIQNDLFNSYSEFEKEFGDYKFISDEIQDRLDELSKGGNVNLKLRPEIDTSELENAGWENVGEGIATVYSSTFSNEDETKFINFTPIIVDPETGQYKGVLSPEDLTEYAEGVIAGTRTDNLNLQIGTEFDSLEDAEKAAEEIHSIGENLQGTPISFDDLYNKLFNFNLGDIDAGQYFNMVNAFTDIVNKSDASDSVKQSLLDSIPSPQDVLNKLDHLKILMGDNWSDELLSNFDYQDLEVVAKFSATDDPYTYDEIREKIESYLNPIELEAKVKSVDVADSLDDLEDDWGSLSTTYESTVTNGKEVSAGDLQSVNDDFGGIKDDSGVYTVMANALERYNDALIENVGDTEAAQKGADEVATAYIDLNNSLDNLTEDNADYYEQLLKTNGVENAHEVVQSRLNKTYKTTRSNLEKLSKAFSNVTKAGNSYLDVIDTADKDSDEYIEATNGIVDSVKDLVGIYDQTTGEQVGTFDFIDGDFVRDNIDTIIDAISGVDGALDELYAKAAMVDAEQIYIDAGISMDDYESDLNTLEELVNYANQQDIETWAYLEDDSFYPALQALMSSSQATRDACNAAFSDIGMDIKYNTKAKKIKVPVVNEGGSHSTTVYGGANAGQAVHWDTKEITVDEIEISASKNGKGSTGTGVKNYSGGGSSSSSGGGGSDSGSDSEDSSETFDWVEVQIDRIEEQLTRLDEAVNNVYSNWESRNKNLRKEIELTNTEISKQIKAAQIYEDKANAVDWGSTDSATKSKYIEKIKNGEIIDVNSIEEITNNDDLTEAISEYQDYWQKHIDALDTATTLGITVKEYYKQLFENIESEYDDLITNIEKKNDIIEERITRTEEHGYFVDQKYYKDELKLEEENNKKLLEERGKLIESLNEAVNKGKIESGSEAWNDMYQSIMDVNKAIEESYTNTVKLNNALRQLKWDAFDWVEERISDISAEADFLIGLLQGELNYEDNGQFNNRGFAQAALVGAKYDDTLKKAQRYRDEILKINEDLAKDPNDKNLVERKEELVQAYRDAIEAAEDEKQAMKSLVEEAINKNLEALQKLIDKYKESLSSAKDLYEYSKNIADQTKNITNLQKQLTALSGDDSEEARKRRQELTNQLDAAEQQLEETEWDRYISETGEMLDDLYSDYEEYLTGKLDYITVLMNDMIKYLNLNGSNVQAGIQEVKDMYGMSTLYFEDFGKTSQDMLSSFNNGDFANKLTNISSIIENFKDTMTKVTETSTNGVIKAIEGNSVDIKVNDDGTVSISSKGQTATVGGGGGSGSGKSGSKTTTNGGSKTSSGKTGTWKGNSTDGWWYQYSDGSYPKNQWEKIDGKSYYFDPNGYMLADQYVEGYFLGKDGAWDGGSKSSWKSNSSGWWYESADGNYITGNWALIDGEWYYFDGSGYMATGKRTIGGKSYTFGTDGKWKGYAKGIRRVPNNQMAWTQENESELIFRSSDGAMLTPLNRGDMVFTAEMSQRLWDFASGNIPRFDNGVPNMRSLSTRNINANNNLTVVLPNVESYDDFKRQLKADKNVEDWMQEITIGRVMGNNTLRKNRY